MEMLQRLSASAIGVYLVMYAVVAALAVIHNPLWATLLVSRGRVGRRACVRVVGY